MLHDHPDQTVRAFHAAVMANPQDDSARLILADRLEEVEELERAEFIRIQIELSKQPNRIPTIGVNGKVTFPRHPRLGALWDRHDILMRSHKALGISETTYPPTLESYFARGFITRVSCKCTAWRVHGTWLCLEHPIDKVDLSDKDPLEHSYSLLPIYYWYNSLFYEESIYRLPPSIFDHLPVVAGFLKSGSPRGAIINYTTSTVAMKELSDACLSWARSQNAIPLPAASR